MVRRRTCDAFNIFLAYIHFLIQRDNFGRCASSTVDLYREERALSLRRDTLGVLMYLELLEEWFPVEARTKILEISWRHL
jgi:hypothetical protein